MAKKPKIGFSTKILSNRHFLNEVPVEGKKIPKIEVIPFDSIQINPRFEKPTSNSLICTTYFLNCGDASATRFHARINTLVSPKEGEFTHSIDDTTNIETHNTLEIDPKCEKLPLRGWFGLHNIRLPDSCYVYLVVAYCYKDVEDSSYGPYFNYFKWKFQNIQNSPEQIRDSEVDSLKRKTFAEDFWPTTFFSLSINGWFFCILEL